MCEVIWSNNCDDGYFSLQLDHAQLALHFFVNFAIGRAEVFLLPPGLDINNTEVW